MTHQSGGIHFVNDAMLKTMFRFAFSYTLINEQKKANYLFVLSLNNCFLCRRRRPDDNYFLFVSDKMVMVLLYYTYKCMYKYGVLTLYFTLSIEMVALCEIGCLFYSINFLKKSLSKMYDADASARFAWVIRLR